MRNKSESLNCNWANKPVYVGQVFETRNGGRAIVSSTSTAQTYADGFRCDHSNGMNYWHNAISIANLGDIRHKNNLTPTEFDLVAAVSGE